ncbi:DUF3011 domain-containing protein [Tahibacter harae]|uniref:DUF3011 domain-containing protein n=1 Tax=Tahibacter harae TaxID=2963937 RepID=A0ABT1QRI0_9GAMM|nr:DUF3011 domain-containing protein [Tahibacter harae]MCQ4164862.1 DUF3011 domain-containing protein [Tahibacter harae]
MKTAAVLLLCLATLDALAMRGPDVTCESRDNQRTVCRIPGDGPVHLLRQLSDAPCIENRSWSRTSEGIDVDNGCRAVFATVVPEPEPANRNTYVDLIDAEAEGARAALLERGYTPVRSEKGDSEGELRHFFRTPGRPACLRAVERGGKYRDVDGVVADECL